MNEKFEQTAKKNREREKKKESLVRQRGIVRKSRYDKVQIVVVSKEQANNTSAFVH